MLTHPTLDQLRALHLDGMADAFSELQAQDSAKDLDHAEWLALLLDREAANRNTKRFQSRLRVAKLRHSQAAVEDVDYRAPRRLDEANVYRERQALTQCAVPAARQLPLDRRASQSAGHGARVSACRSR